MKILIFGDSLATGLYYFPSSWDVHIESFPGETTTNLLQREEKKIGLSLFLSEDKYDVIIITAGTNDVGHKENVSTIVKNISLMVDIASASTKLVIVMSVPYCTEINRELSKLAVTEHCEFCEFFEYLNDELTEADGLHLNEEGKKICCEMLEELIYEFIH